TGDHPQYLARRSLLFQSLSKLAVTGTEFIKQPHILDRDNSLISEGFKELDLRRGEGAHLDATRGQYPNKFPLLTKGGGQIGAPAAGGTYHREIFLGADIRNVERAMLAHPAILQPFNTDLDECNGYGAKMSPRNHTVALFEAEYHVVNPANLSRA